MTDHREEDLEERRRRLARELAGRDSKDKDEERAEIRAEQTRKGYGMAMKISSEFVSAVIVGAILGYLFDHFVGTGPWGMIVMLLLGFCAGVLNVMRTVGMVASPHPADRGWIWKTRVTIASRSDPEEVPASGGESERAERVERSYSSVPGSEDCADRNWRN